MAAHHKSEKQKALKKQKAQVAAQRTERLAHRNPQRLQTQIDDLLAQKEAQGSLRPRDAEMLDKLEREVKAIRKARDAAGRGEGGSANANDREGEGRRRQGDGSWEGRRGGAGRGRGGSALGKRRRDGDQGGGSESEETDPEVRDIPMPRDTPPPIPPRWLRKKNRQNQSGRDEEEEEKPKVAPKTTYSSAPQLRDLRKEATSAFVPAAVLARQKQVKAAKGEGHDTKLLEPEELDRLEKEAMRDTDKVAREAEKEEAHLLMARQAGGDVDLDAEEEAFRRELSGASMPPKANEEIREDVEMQEAGTIHQATVEDVEDDED